MRGFVAGKAMQHLALIYPGYRARSKRDKKRQYMILLCFLIFPSSIFTFTILSFTIYRNSNRNFTSAPKFPISFRSPRRDIFLFRMYSMRNTCSGVEAPTFDE